MRGGVEVVHDLQRDGAGSLKPELTRRRYTGPAKSEFTVVLTSSRRRRSHNVEVVVGLSRDRQSDVLGDETHKELKH